MFRNCGREPDLTQPDDHLASVCPCCDETECRRPDVCEQFHRLGRVVTCECGEPIGDDETTCTECEVAQCSL